LLAKVERSQKTKSYYANLQPQSELHYKPKAEKKYSLPHSNASRKTKTVPLSTDELSKKTKTHERQVLVKRNYNPKNLPLPILKTINTDTKYLKNGSMQMQRIAY
jgi:hypothetical protein